MRKKYCISGKVQGVSFRASAQQCAEDLQLHGWVCNLHNGDVLLEAVGSAEQLNTLEQWLAKGPRYAKVDQVQTEVLDEAAALAYDGFIIKPDQAP